MSHPPIPPTAPRLPASGRRAHGRGAGQTAGRPTPPTLRAGWLLALLLLGLPRLAGAAEPATLYQQLGGRDGIQAVTARLIERSARDPRTAAALRGARLEPLKRQVADYVCELSGGPCVFRDGGPAHYGRLAVTEPAFAVMMATLREELQATGVPLAAQAELLRRLSPPTSAVIVAETPP